MTSSLLFGELQSEVLNSLNLFDFSPAFPDAYSGSKSVLLVPGWPMDLIDQMLSEPGGQMTRPVISVLAGDITTDERSLGGVTTLGGGSRTAVRVSAAYVVTCWADMLMGGADTVVALGSLVVGWALINRQALTAFRQLATHHSGEAYEARPQVWAYNVTISGYALLSYS